MKFRFGKLEAILFVFFNLLVANPAIGQSCNPADGWVKTLGTYTIGNSAIFGPNCEQIQDSGVAPAISVQQIGGARLVLNPDCGSILQASVAATGKTYAVTFPAIGAVAPGCRVSVNAPALRGIQLIVPGFPQRILWPGQTIEYTAGSSWFISVEPGPWYAKTAVNFCVNHNSGNDSQDGLDTNGSINTPATTGCLAAIQTCVNVFYQQVDLAGQAPTCTVWGPGAYVDTASMGGQLTGNNLLTIVAGSAFTWQNTATCVIVADNAELNVIAIPGTITWNCNTANGVNAAAFFLHQMSVLDASGTFVFLSHGANDNFFIADGEGRATINVTMTIGDGTVRNMQTMLWLQGHAAGITASGVWTPTANQSASAAVVVTGGSLLATSATGWQAGWTAIGASQATGNSVVRLSGVAAPQGGVTATTGSQVCATTC